MLTAKKRVRFVNSKTACPSYGVFTVGSSALISGRMWIWVYVLQPYFCGTFNRALRRDVEEKRLCEENSIPYHDPRCDLGRMYIDPMVEKMIRRDGGQLLHVHTDAVDVFTMPVGIGWRRKSGRAGTNNQHDCARQTEMHVEMRNGRSAAIVGATESLYRPRSQTGGHAALWEPTLSGM